MMISNSTIRSFPGAGVLLIATAYAAIAQTPLWEDELRKQLLKEKECELNYLTDAKQYELLGRKTVEVRAHCKDKRAYDAKRSGDEKLFELKSCEIVTC